MPIVYGVRTSINVQAQSAPPYTITTGRDDQPGRRRERPAGRRRTQHRARRLNVDDGSEPHQAVCDRRLAQRAGRRRPEDSPAAVAVPAVLVGSQAVVGLPDPALAAARAAAGISRCSSRSAAADGRAVADAATAAAAMRKFNRALQHGVLHPRRQRPEPRELRRLQRQPSVAVLRSADERAAAASPDGRIVVPFLIPNAQLPTTNHSQLPTPNERQLGVRNWEWLGVGIGRWESNRIPNVNITVVGAGVVGCAVAYELASRGAHVQLVDPRGPGRGATGASAGILAPLIEGHSPSLLRLGTCSVALWDDFIRRIQTDSGQPVEYERSGTLHVALNDAQAGELSQSGPRSRSPPTCRTRCSTHVTPRRSSRDSPIERRWRCSCPGMATSGPRRSIDALVRAATARGVSMRAARAATRPSTTIRDPMRS